ncbi:MAG: acylphosphatase [Bacteroidales bacterium]
MKRLKMKITGRVQGVAFRHYAQTKASQNGVKGYVKNMPDGSVEIEAEGDEKALDGFVSWCHQGPDAARVEDIKVQEIPVKNDKSFNIRY